MDEIKVNNLMMQVTKVVGEMIELKKNNPDKYQQEIEFMRPIAYRICLNKYGNLATEDELKRLVDVYLENLLQDPSLLHNVYGMILGASSES